MQTLKTLIIAFTLVIAPISLFANWSSSEVEALCQSSNSIKTYQQLSLKVEDSLFSQVSDQKASDELDRVFIYSVFNFARNICHITLDNNNIVSMTYGPSHPI
ncbi:hypothetical protein E2K93_11260 [Thalassotalea sp. HSM 43]|uniref:hypothetical protein n=1 Tax=Thalassotalea sp. HSM 43 TaxID=2552945 RepID=UPI0010810537|nr:hypothetical protein [Thalassotalea sp. HSM 43]QBY04925.1 hypothetical protein E2K93_11260 [Thalassotalea sp. HSM 43]